MDTIDVPLPFPQDSALRIVFRERIVQLSGLRALLLQGLNPTMVAGFLQHSDMFVSKEHTAKRLIKTSQQMNKIYFSNDAQAIQKQCYSLRKGHSYVKGTFTDQQGKETEYNANDPEHLLWVIATIADSAWTFYTMFNNNDKQLREAFWREYRIVGKLFGLSEQDLPTEWKTLQEYIDNTGPKYKPLDEAKQLAKTLFYSLDPPGYLKILSPAVKIMTRESLPDWALQKYDLPQSIIESQIYKVSSLGQKHFAKILPNQIRYVPTDLLERIEKSNQKL